MSSGALRAKFLASVAESERRHPPSTRHPRRPRPDCNAGVAIVVTHVRWASHIYNQRKTLETLHSHSTLNVARERRGQEHPGRLEPRSLCSEPLSLGSRTRRAFFRCLSAPPRHKMTPARNSAVFLSAAGLRSPQRLQSDRVTGSARAWGLAWLSAR